jgi:hypothetical protein
MIKNYTSTVPASRSVSNIERRLVAFGATNIIKSYDQNKTLSEICFVANVQGRDVPFKLPAKVDAVYKILMRSVRRPRPGSEERIREQAERSAWKILNDSVDIDLSMIEIGNAEFMEKFMAYAVINMDTRETLYDRLKGTGFKMLEAPK